MARQNLDNLETRLSFRTKLNDNFTELYTAKDAAVALTGSQTITGTKTFYSSGIKLNNPANTFAYTFVAGAIAADRTVTLPLLAGNDILVTEAFSQALTNKTIAAASNTITGVYLLASGGTLTGANTITGTTTNIVKYVFDALGSSAITNGAGLWLANTTAAAAGAQQYSPSLVLEGQGWKTGGTPGSQGVRWALQTRSIQGTTNPTGALDIMYSYGASGYAAVATFQEDRVNLTTGYMIQWEGNAQKSIRYASNTMLFSSFGDTTFTHWNGAAYTERFRVHATNITATSGTEYAIAPNTIFSPTTGTAGFSAIITQGAVDQTGSASGAIKMLELIPTYTSVLGTVIGVDYNPTVTLVSGTHMAFRATSGNVLVGGTTLTTSAILELQSTTRAFIPPRMTTTQKNAIGTPSSGMVVYDSTLNKLCVYGAAGWETVTSV